MRLKLNLFHIHSNSQSSDRIMNYNLKFNKIVFPINLNENFTIRDLRFGICKFLMNFCKCEIEVEYLCLNEFYLVDEFEIHSILNSDDEIR